jgi:L-ascorbate metabolism protein UlaG (beta-lactamase superfamily)
MKPMFLFALLCTVATPLSAKPVVGEPAPAFSAIDSHGKTHALADYAGKTVVLEWSNPECPFVRKHYGAGNLQKQQGDATAHGVVWLTVNSGAPGKQGHFDAAGANAWIAKVGSKASAYLIDGDGKVGHAYDAKTTPHLYVIDGGGMLRYMGGIDSIQSADPDDIAKATQYVPQALAELAAGKAVSAPTSEPYGCSVKYGAP